MLSNDELKAIKALGLAPEVEKAIISLNERRRELLFTGDRKVDRKQVTAKATAADTGEDQSGEAIKSISGSRKSQTNRAASNPWDVQFSD